MKMNLNVFKFFLILLLVCSLLLDVESTGDKKSRRKKKHSREKKKSKMAATTAATSYMTTVEQEILLKDGPTTTDTSISMTNALTTTKRSKKKKGGKRKKQKRKKKLQDSSKNPMSKIMDLLFEEDKDSFPVIETTARYVTQAGHITEHTNKEGTTESTLLKPDEKDPKNGIIKETLYLEETKKEKVTLEVMYGDKQITSPVSSILMENDTKKHIFPSKDNEIPPLKSKQIVGADECTSKAIEAKFQDLVSRRKVPKHRIDAWKNSRVEIEKMKILNQTLTDLLFQPLPRCNEISATAPNEIIITLPIRKPNKHPETGGNENRTLGSNYDEAKYHNEIEKENDEHDSDVKERNIGGATEKIEVVTNQVPLMLNQTEILKLNQDSNADNKAEKNCSLGLHVTNLEQAYEIVRKMEEKRMIPIGTTQKAIDGEISLLQLKKIVLEAAVTAKKLPPECLDTNVSQGRPPRVEGSISPKERQQLNQVTALIQAGYLPPDTLAKFARGEITREWLKANVSKNRDLILSRLPESIGILINKGKMPANIEAAIFSGSYNKTEIGKMIVQDDALIKNLLPQKLLDMLQDRPVPMDIKILLISGKNSSEIEAEIRANDTILQQMMSPSMFFFYELFEVEVNRILNVAISVTVVIVLAFVMVSLGCTMTVTKIAEHAKKPKGVIIALFAQFVIMPAAAFGLTQLFDLELYSAMAVLICGCCPGGNLSNMLAYSMSGDMNLSILMTTCSSVLGLGFMPLSIYLYSRFIIPVDSGAIVPFDKIVINIAMTIIPVGIGILIRHYRPQWVTNVMRVGGAVLVVCSITVAVLAGIMLGDAFFVYFPVPVLACCAILPMTGYLFGYIFAWIAGETPKCRRTICVETGCQNVQLCGTVLKLAFNPILVGVLFLMPLIYMLFQVVEAFLIIFVFRMYNRLRGREELVEEDSEVKKKSDIESGDEEKKKDKQDENKALLNEESSSSASKTTEHQPKKNEEDNSDLTEIWPLDGKPTPAYLDSFKTVGNENFV